MARSWSRPATVERLAGLAEVAPPLSVELKGLDAPVAPYELRGLGGRFAQGLPDADEDGVEVALPLVGAIVEGKRIHAEAFAGAVRRLGRRALEAAVDAELAALTNVRLRLTHPDPTRESSDIYGKVTGVSLGRGAGSPGSLSPRSTPRTAPSSRGSSRAPHPGRRAPCPT